MVDISSGVPAPFGLPPRMLRRLGQNLHPARQLTAFVVGMAVLATIGTGFGMSRLVAAAVRHEAVAGAEQTAAVFGDLAFQSDDYVAGRLTPLGRRGIRRGVEATHAIRGVRIWDRSGRVVYRSGVARPVGR